MLAPLLAAVSLAVLPATGSVNLALDGQPIVSGLPVSYPLKVLKTSARQDSPTHATVDLAFTDGSSAVCDYALAGNDCTLAFSLTNRAGQPHVVDLSGLHCAFAPGAPLSGTLAHWHWTFCASPKVWHPGLLSPVGAVYAADSTTAAVFYSPSEFGAQSLFVGSWGLAHLPNPFDLQLHTRHTIAPGATGTVSLVIRLTDDLSPAGLYGGYQQFLARKYPRPLHVPDARPAAMFSSVDKFFVTPDNPGGYNGELRRFDRPAGVAAFLTWVADPLQAAHAQGCLFWAPGGVDPVMYPPDFDVNLARIAGTWPALVAGFRARGLRVGLCARAAENVDRSVPAHPFVTPIDPGDPRQVEALLARFSQAAALGVDAYYLDTFGHTWESLQLLPLIRQTVGPDVPIYTEYCTDATLPYADRYCEYSGGETVAWLSPEQFTALRFLFPQAVWMCLSRTPEAWPSDFARLGLTPLIQDYQVRDTLAPAAADSRSAQSPAALPGPRPSDTPLPAGGPRASR